MREVVIEPEKEGKGRSFSATMLAMVQADRLWSGGLTSGETIRPVWAMFGGSEQELRAFSANLMLGKKVTFPSTGYRRDKDRLECLKSAGYQTAIQRCAAGSLLTVFLPDLFRLDPGMVDPNEITFILLPSKEWHASQELDSTKIHKHLRKLGAEVTPEYSHQIAVTAHLFAAYLDRRTRCPLIADGRFYTQLMLACLRAGFASYTRPTSAYWRESERAFGVHPRLGYQETDIEDVGLLPGVAFTANHESFEETLATEVERFLGLSK